MEEKLYDQKKQYKQQLNRDLEADLESSQQLEPVDFAGDAD